MGLYEDLSSADESVQVLLGSFRISHAPFPLEKSLGYQPLCHFYQV